MLKKYRQMRLENYRCVFINAFKYLSIDLTIYLYPYQPAYLTLSPEYLDHSLHTVLFVDNRICQSYGDSMKQ